MLISCFKNVKEAPFGDIIQRIAALTESYQLKNFEFITQDYLNDDNADPSVGAEGIYVAGTQNFYNKVKEIVTKKGINANMINYI